MMISILGLGCAVLAGLGLCLWVWGWLTSLHVTVLEQELAQVRERLSQSRKLYDRQAAELEHVRRYCNLALRGFTGGEEPTATQETDR